MKILMVGLGGAGQRHLRLLSGLLGKKAEFIAYRKIGRKQVITKAFSLEEEQTVEEKYGVTSYYNLEDAIKQKPEVAFISNPTSEHVKSALSLVKSGCHLFIEKPLSHNLDDVQELIRIAKEKSLVVYIGYQMRFHPCIQLMKKLIKENKIGKILSCNVHAASYMPSWHPYESYKELYAARKDLGGGVILTESHELDYIYWFFGMPKNVFAIGGKYSNLDIDVEDTAGIILDYGSFIVNAYLSFVQQPPTRSCQINGENGAISWDGINKISVYDVSKSKWNDTIFDNFEREHMFINELKHFLACVNKKEKPLIDTSEGLNSLKIALAAKQSIKTGKLSVV